MDIGIHHVGVVTRDLERSTAFYTRLLGGRVEPMAGHTIVESGAVRIAIVVATAEDPATYARGHHLAFRLGAAERAPLLERLNELGAPHEDVRGRLYTQDPDGFTLEFLFEAS